MRWYIIGAIALAGIVAVGIYTAKVYEAGGSGEREKNLQAANKSLKEMEKDHGEILSLDTDDYCAEYGYKWVPELGECG